ncbi:unnamed protein product [Schistosoma rodhaini]|uniref:Rapamycin-insensitive companion of mTOR domain-containing protein n=1 Tax=Schistosoma rodhaini TaxID=6188 RepID=A0AA85FCF4_9TREM|nr:unnamed protein product [Schistosoma rodhaini]CAH8666490.1 unnamed protein product [Schistosoma rodhaini]
MHQEFRLRDLKGFRPTGASLRYSVTFLQIDLKKDTFYVLNNLLKGIYNDFTNACLRSKESDVSFQVSAQRRIVARLNVLVLISQRVFEAVRGLPHLRTPLLRSVYHILRLPLWHHNPSLRCAALRCLRYYVHSSVDVELLLECRLDLLIARCMDLSYYPTNFISSNGLSGNSSATSRVNSNPRTKFLVTSNPPISSTCNSSSCQLSEESSNHQLISNHYQSSGVLLKGTNATSTRNSSPSFLSSFGERQIVLRLIYYITRLTPQLIPSSIIHAVAAPCLEVHRYLIANSNESSNKGDAHAASGVGVPAVVSRHIPRNLHHRIGDFGEAKVKISGFNDSELDTTIRGCLLILAELVILALERLILRTNPSVVNHSKIKLSYSNYYYYYCHYYYHYYYDHHHDVDHTNNHHRQFYNNDNSNDNNKSNVSMDNGIEKKLLLLFPLIGQIIIQALMTTFVCNNSTMHTYHSSRIHEAVILSLIAVLNRSEYAQLLPNSLISKFFVTFTSSSYFLHRSKLSFNVYPSFPICARNCLILLLRSWPGIFHFIHDGLPTLQTLLYTLGVGNTEIRNQILSLLYGLFPTIPIPHSSVKELEPTILGLIEALSTGSSSLLPVINLSSSPGKRSDYLRNEMSSSYLDSSSRRLFSILPVRCISSSSSSAWDIEGDFISAEGCRLLIKYDSIGIDLMNNYYAILLATLVEAGLYEALIRAVSDSNQVTSTRAGYLLGVLAYKVQSLLPQEHPACRRLHHAGLLHPETPGSQLAVLWLERIHRAMRLHETQLIDISNLIHVPLHSPFLECLAKQSANNISPTYYPLNPLQPDQMELTDTILDQLIASSNVLSFKSKSQHGRFSQCQVTTYDTKSPELWNWNILTSLGRHLAVTRCTFSWESKSHMKFLKAVMEFLIPDQTCRTGVSDCKTEKCTNPISPPVVYSIPSKSMQSSDGLLPVDGLLNAISDNRNFMLQNFITFNTHDNIDRLLVHSREKNISESNVTSTIMNNNSNTSRSNYLISPNANFNLAWLSYNWPHASAAGILAAGLITHLAHYPPASEPFQYLDRFLTALHLCLKFVLNKQSNKSLISHNHDNSGNNKSMDQKLSQDNNSIHNDSNNTNMILTFHSNYLAKSCGGLILFAASRLTNSEVGELRLEKSDLYLDFQSILMFPSQLKKSSNSHAETHYNDTDDKRNEQCVFLNHAKIILSSLDYSHSTKLSRLLLTTAVNSGVKPLRMYTIRLIRLLFRLKLPFLASWCIDLVVKLCMDSSNKIRRLALCLLEELCWDPVNVQALSQNILHNQTNDDNNNIVCQKNLLTPFAIYLLHGNTGPIGHRIFGRVLSITTIFDKLCMNHDILRQPNSSFLHCDYGCCCTPQTNKNCPNSCLSHDELNISNNGNNNKSVLSDPVNWMLDIARKYYNVAYAQEMDSRFTSLFVTYGTKLLSCASYKSTSFTYFDSAAINLQIPSPLNFNNNTDDEENSDRVDRPSNSEFNFEDNYFIEETDSMSGTYVSPSLVNDQSIGQVADGHDSFHCLPLPKHLYACIAEHRNGINLLDTRKDLETAVANMRSVLPQIINDKYEETNTFSDSNSLLKLKADMWALAHTCSTSYGQYWLLKHPELMTLFTSLALHSNSMNIRAVAWICLNLIATSSNQIFRHHNCLGMLQNDRTSKHINDLNCNESLSDWLFIPQIFYGRDVKTNEGAQDEMIVYPEIQSLSEQMVQTKLKPNRLLSDIFSVIPPVTNFGTETKNENLSLSAQKSVKSSVRNQVFENFNRSRRRLHRRWSPNHRRLSPPISESREHSSFHFMSFVKPKHSINSFTQIASFNYDVSYVNISSKKPYSTWTHRDCIPQRQVVSPVFTPSGSAHAVDHDDHELTDSKPNSNLDTRWLLQSLFHCVNKNQIIYLPTDIKILGFKKYTKNKQKYTIMNPIKSLQLSSSSLFDSKTNVSTKPFYNDNSHCLFRSLNSPDNNKHSISFIDVAVHVQLMLSLYSNDKLSTLSSIPDEVSTDTTNYTAKNNINQLSSLQHSSCDKENRLYSSRIQIADHSNSFLSRQENRTSEKSSLIFDEIHSVSAQPSTPSVLSSNQNYFEHENHELSISAKHSVEKLGAVDNWLVSSEVNETNLTKNDNVSHRLSVVKMSSEEYIIPVDVNQSPELSINDHHQLKNTNDHDGSNDNNNGWNNTENKANSSVHSNCLLPNTCLSYSCSLTNNDNSDSQCDQEMTEQDMWCNQLLDSISNLSSNVFSCSSSHDNNSNTLDEIIHKALITQKNFKGSIQLFNACTYTIIADLLGSYPFSRSIRTKIQSVFLYFELDELMVDANNSLIEVEKYLKSESKLTE